MTAARRATRAELPALAAVLARALAEDPGWIHLFPEDATRVGRMTAMMRAMIGRAYLRLGETWMVEGAGAVWAPPGRRHVSIARQVSLVPRLAWLLRSKVATAWKMFGIMEGRAPREPHWYLSTLGVDPARQGQGLGVAVVRPVLEICDRDRVLAWLESTNPRNHGFYRRLGFEVAEQVPMAGGPTFTFFARRPR